MKTQDTAKVLYQVEYCSKAYPETRFELMSEDQFLAMKKQNEWYTVMASTKIGKMWPFNTTVKKVSESHSSCYAKCHYEVKSPEELNDYHFQVLRAQGCFMNGQECGKVISKSQDADGYTYVVRSICDSSD